MHQYTIYWRWRNRDGTTHGSGMCRRNGPFEEYPKTAAVLGKVPRGRDHFPALQPQLCNRHLAVGQWHFMRRFARTIKHDILAMHDSLGDFLA